MEPRGSSEANSSEADVETAYTEGVKLSRGERFLKDREEAGLLGGHAQAQQRQAPSRVRGDRLQDTELLEAAPAGEPSPLALYSSRTQGPQCVPGAREGAQRRQTKPPRRKGVGQSSCK